MTSVERLGNGDSMGLVQQHVLHGSVFGMSPCRFCMEPKSGPVKGASSKHGGSSDSMLICRWVPGPMSGDAEKCSRFAVTLKEAKGNSTAAFLISVA